MSLLLFLKATEIIPAFGLFGIFLAIFAESGLFFGFFLPGDSLLFTAGLLASEGQLNIVVLIIGTFLAAVLGDSVGYAFGKRVGPRLFKRPDSFFFKKEYAERAEKFYERHGKSTIILARFIPIIRTFAPIIAGVGQMKYRIFLGYNVVGGLIWTVLLCSLGYFLGKTAPNIDKYLLPIILGIIILSFLPPIFQYWRNKKN
ncbi:MAG TPA: VTT domain-containing protein [Candidatus Paceibacterota bacterium]|nr:VTT domain-containing protein [Candidatus Paceibacterota bacterium]